MYYYHIQISLSHTTVYFSLKINLETWFRKEIVYQVCIITIKDKVNYEFMNSTFSKVNTRSASVSFENICFRFSMIRGTTLHCVVEYRKCC